MKIGFISLGCSKNLVDTEMMIGYYKNQNYEIVQDPSEAEVIVINTCGFIESAKQEAIDTILEMAEYKNGLCQKLIVTGCLVERYYDELKEEMPEVDLFIPIREYDKIFEVLDYHNRVISTGENFAYLRIADGCSNNCTYCAIPKIRGPLVSRPMEDVIKEAKELFDKGYKELILIAQDTSRYGLDLYGESKLAELLKEICKIDFKWVRFLYTYPEMITDELIEVVKSNEKICRYFDMPIQHISNPVLKRMGRKGSSELIREVINKIRTAMPDAALRTSLIVGFPGETEEQFNELLDFVKEVKFNRLGAFKYSMEDGTPAVKLDGHADETVKEERHDKIMEAQQLVSEEFNASLINKTFECIIDAITEDGEYYVCRTYMDVPDIDGLVFVKNEKEHSVGEFIKAKVEQTLEYDLVAIEI
jgi:ribosomal protein S12 methylthiotransferase